MESNENDGFNFTSTNEVIPASQPDFTFPDKYEVGEKQAAPVENTEKMEEVESVQPSENQVTPDRETNNKEDIGYTAPSLSLVPPRQSSGSEEEDSIKESQDPPPAKENSEHPPPADSAPAITHDHSTSDNNAQVNEVHEVNEKSEEPIEVNEINAETLPDTVPVSSSQDSESKEDSSIHPDEEMKVDTQIEHENVEPKEVVESKESAEEEPECVDVDSKDNAISEEKTEVVEDVNMTDTAETEKANPTPEKEKVLEEVKEDVTEIKVEDVKKEQDSKQEEEKPVEAEKVPKTPKDVILEHINTVYQYLDDFMKTKDEVKIKDCMTALIELKSLAEKTLDSTTLTQGNSRQKGKRGKEKQTKVRETPSSKKEKKESDSDSEMFELVNLRDIKGLAVFAKWPNSGWFYPGVVKNLQLKDWKSSTNVTVSFYDGLEREMKSIHILPAQLIPNTSVLFDLDEELEVTVVSSEREDNWVKFSLSQNDKPDEVIQRDFDKLAIKGASMKAIKQAIDSNTSDTGSNKTNPVSADNLVAGRRMRGKSSLFNEDYISSSPRSTEKRRGKTEEDNKNTPSKTPAKRKSKADEDASEAATPAKTASKRRQVNGGTKSTPRRKAAKGK